MIKKNDYITPKEASNMLGVTPATLRRWANTGKISCIKITNGDRRYPLKEIQKLSGQEPTQRKIVYYIRSSNGNKTLIESQEKLLRSTCPEPDKIYKDKASGLNEKRRGLKSLIKSVKNNEISTIYITTQDRLTRFGYSYLEELFNIYDTDIVILNSKRDKSMYDELIEDFMSLIASFSGKYYKLKSKENGKKFLTIVNKEFNKE